MKNKKGDTEKGFNVGYELGIDLIDQLGKKTNGMPDANHMAGVLSSIINFGYSYAPSLEAMNQLIAFAKEYAEQESEEIKKGERL